MARILALDYGLKRIGVALSDETRLIASAYPALANGPGTMSELLRLVTAYNVDAFLLGKPLHEGGGASFLPHVLAFGQELHSRFGFPVYLYDESLSSKTARSFLIGTGKRGKKLKDKLDSASAQSVLAEFLPLLEKGRAECFLPSSQE